MKSEILRILRNAVDYTSGQELCNKLNVSRTAIWKNINILKEDGYEIDSVTNKGYMITSYPDVVTGNEIESRIGTKIIGKKIVYEETVDSTNTLARKYADKGADHGTVFVAETQQQGKGRRGRKWESPKGTGVWMSILLKPEIETVNASMLTLVAALAGVEGINECLGVDSKIKWPNDLVLDNKKICGMLTEMSTEIETINYVIVGIGINVNTEQFPEEIDNVATSLSIQFGKKINRAGIICSVLEKFEYYYNIFLETEDLSALMDIYNERLINIGKQVKLIRKNEEVIRVSHGINKLGELLVEDEENNIEEIMSGEVSVRGLYGYV